MSTAGVPEIGEAQREDAVWALSRHHTEGRLDATEFDERVRAARAATTRDELAAQFTDLPGPHPAAIGPSGGAPTARYPVEPPYPDRQQYPHEQPYPHGQPYHPAGGHPGWNAYGQGPSPYAGSYPPHPGPPAYGPYGGADPSAPFGREPFSGRPYSEKQKIVAGLLQLFLPLGIGRFYSGHTGLAVAQLLVTLVTFGLGGIWSFIDGIVILAGSPTDPYGRPLRP